MALDKHLVIIHRQLDIQDVIFIYTIDKLILLKFEVGVANYTYKVQLKTAYFQRVVYLTMLPHQTTFLNEQFSIKLFFIGNNWFSVQKLPYYTLNCQQCFIQI